MERLKKIFRPLTKSSRRRRAIACAILAMATAACAVLCCTIFVSELSRELTFEIDSRVELDHVTESPVYSRICRIVTDTDSLDTSRLAEYTVELRLFGFIPARCTARIVDTTPPVIEARDVTVTVGTPLAPSMFVHSVTDKTYTEFSFVGAEPTIASPSLRYVRLVGTDEGGNKTEFTAKLTVTEPFAFEYGVSIDEIEKTIRKSIRDVEDFDLAAISGCGTFRVTGESENRFATLEVSVADTTPPVAVMNDLDIMLGEKITRDELIKSISDKSEFKTEALSELDLESPGEQTVSFRFTDEHGNAETYHSTVRIHTIDDEVTVELGTSLEDVYSLVCLDDWSRGRLLLDATTVYLDRVGTYPARLIGDGGEFDVTITVSDTTSPTLVLKSIVRIIGDALTPEDFVASCSDSDATLRFTEVPSSELEGTFAVGVSATDESGNETVEAATVTFIRDTAPPVISGHRDLVHLIGDELDLFVGVTASDAESTDVELLAEIGELNTNVPGEYPVTYVARDRSGNTARESIRVTVKAPTRVCLDVKNILQNPALPNGCEVVSLAIALAYSSHPIDPVTLYDKYMPKSSTANGDPWIQYLGNAKGLGLGCYAPCVVTTGNSYLRDVGSSKTVHDVSGRSMADYEAMIDSGTPVIMWGCVRQNANPTVYWSGFVNGREVVWHYYSHCLVLIGYTDDTYIFCDPQVGVVEYSREATERSFEINFRQACIIK